MNGVESVGDFAEIDGTRINRNIDDAKSGKIDIVNQEARTFFYRLVYAREGILLPLQHENRY